MSPPLSSRSSSALCQVERISEDPGDASHKDDRKRFLKVFAGKRLGEARVCAIVHQLGSQVTSRCCCC